MTNKEALEALVARYPSQAALARAIPVHRSVVTRWLQRGEIPLEWVERVEAGTGVPRYQLLPDFFIGKKRSAA